MPTDVAEYISASAANCCGPLGMTKLELQAAGLDCPNQQRQNIGGQHANSRNSCCLHSMWHCRVCGRAFWEWKVWRSQFHRLLFALVLIQWSCYPIWLKFGFLLQYCTSICTPLWAMAGHTANPTVFWLWWCLPPSKVSTSGKCTASFPLGQMRPKWSQLRNMNYAHDMSWRCDAESWRFACIVFMGCDKCIRWFCLV